MNPVTLATTSLSPTGRNARHVVSDKDSGRLSELSCVSTFTTPDAVFRSRTVTVLASPERLSAARPAVLSRKRRAYAVNAAGSLSATAAPAGWSVTLAARKAGDLGLGSAALRVRAAQAPSGTNAPDV